jgi:hypothetical protein
MSDSARGRRIQGLGRFARRASIRARIAAALLAVILISLLALHLAGRGGSAPRDTRNGLVGRLTPACDRGLAELDHSVVAKSGAAGIPPATENAGLAVASELATECLAGITDWPVAVAPLQKRLQPAALTAGKTTPAITCDPPATWAQLGTLASREFQGYVEEAETLIHLSPVTCLGLARLLRHPGALACVAAPFGQRCPPSLALEAIAIVVLAHEQQHVDGETNEALAQCYAYQRARVVSRQLGVPSRVAARVAAFVHMTATFPYAYQSTECRHGGSFDLRLPEPWPLPS